MIALSFRGLLLSLFWFLNMKKEKIDELVATGYDFDIEKSFRDGWEMFKSKPLYSMSYTTFIIILQLSFALYMSDFAFIFTVFLAAPLYSGFFLAANKISRGEEVFYSDFFTGFQYYVPVVAVWLVGRFCQGLDFCCWLCRAFT